MVKFGENLQRVRQTKDWTARNHANAAFELSSFAKLSNTEINGR